MLLRVLSLVVVFHTFATVALADLSHWFFRAKVDLGKDRIYDVDVDGLPVAGKRQGRSRKGARAFGFDIGRVEVCVAEGEWAPQVGYLRRTDKHQIEFVVQGCLNTKIRVHINRPIKSSDMQPEALVRYLSGLFDIEGFGTEGKLQALNAALTDATIQEDRVRVAALELPRTEDYRGGARLYGGGVRLVSTSHPKARYPWATLILVRSMTSDEAALGALGLLDQFRSKNLRLLSTVYGKKLKKNLDVLVAEFQGRPHLSVQYSTRSYKRRDYFFDETSSMIYYMETTAGQANKVRDEVDAGIMGLLNGARFGEAPASSGGALSLLTELAAPPAGPPAAGTKPAAASSQTYSPSIKVVSVSVQPAEVGPGDELDLLIQYEVGGIPPGVSFEVKEVRQLVLGETPLASVEDTVARTAGTFTSVKTIRVPANAKPGVYTHRADVALAGVTAEGSALFRVR